MRKFYIGMIFVSLIGFVLSLAAFLFNPPNYFLYFSGFSTFFHFVALREYTKIVVEIQNLDNNP